MMKIKRLAFLAMAFALIFTSVAPVATFADVIDEPVEVVDPVDEEETTDPVDEEETTEPVDEEEITEPVDEEETTDPVDEEETTDPVDEEETTEPVDEEEETTEPEGGEEETDEPTLPIADTVEVEIQPVVVFENQEYNLEDAIVNKDDLPQYYLTYVSETLISEVGKYDIVAVMNFEDNSTKEIVIPFEIQEDTRTIAEKTDVTVQSVKFRNIAVIDALASISNLSELPKFKYALPEGFSFEDGEGIYTFPMTLTYEDESVDEITVQFELISEEEAAELEEVTISFHVKAEEGDGQGLVDFSWDDEDQLYRAFRFLEVYMNEAEVDGFIENMSDFHKADYGNYRILIHNGDFFVLYDGVVEEAPEEPEADEPGTDESETDEPQTDKTQTDEPETDESKPVIPIKDNTKDKGSLPKTGVAVTAGLLATGIAAAGAAIYVAKKK